MRIALINNLYPPYVRGGAERVVETIARELQREGHTVAVITTVPSWTHMLRALFSRGWIDEQIDGITVYRIATLNFFPYWTIGNHHVFFRFFWHLFDIFSFETAATVRHILRKEQSDVVMTHNMMGIGFLIPRAIRRLRVRHIHAVHDVQLAVPSGLLVVGARPSLLLAGVLQLYERLLRWLIGSPDVVISPSQWLLDFYAERGFFPQSKKVVLHNAIATPLPEQRRRCIPLVSSGYNFLRFLYVGQLEKHKGILLLLDAIKKLEIATTFDGVSQDAVRNWKLEIVGDGSLLSRIQKETQSDSHITVHGAVPHEKLSEFYQNADALIVPSLIHENAPTVIVEAFAHGLPVIASRVGGIPEFVQESETGWLFTAGNTTELLEVFQKIFKNRTQLNTMYTRLQSMHVTHAPERYCATLLSLV